MQPYPQHHGSCGFLGIKVKALLLPPSKGSSTPHPTHTCPAHLGWLEGEAGALPPEDKAPNSALLPTWDFLNHILLRLWLLMAAPPPPTPQQSRSVAAGLDAPGACKHTTQLHPLLPSPGRLGGCNPLAHHPPRLAAAGLGALTGSCGLRQQRLPA